MPSFAKLENIAHTQLGWPRGRTQARAAGPLPGLLKPAHFFKDSMRTLFEKAAPVLVLVVHSCCHVVLSRRQFVDAREVFRCLAGQRVTDETTLSPTAGISAACACGRRLAARRRQR